MSRRLTLALLIFSVIFVGCASGETSATTTIAATTSSTASTTTTVAPPSTSGRPSRLESMGYPISNEWVVETVVSDIPVGTGGLAIADDGTMYQADFGFAGMPGDGVYRIDPDGTVEIFSESDDFTNLTMTAFGADGNLYQTSYGSGQVFRIEEDGTAVLLAEGLRGPTGIVGLDDGTLIVESYDASIIHRIAPDGTVSDWVSRYPGFNGLNGITQGPDGTFYVINHRDGGLFAVTEDGTVTDLHMFPRATSHVAYLDGSLFVTSRGGYVVFRYDLETGYAEVIAGNGEPENSDGRGTESSFGRPNAITVGPDGALYFNHAREGGNTPVDIKRITHQP